MSQYYLGDPCYVIPDAEWDDFCKIMRYDGEDFEYKDETCRVIGTGGDGDFGGLSVDAGIIGVIPVSLCDYCGRRSGGEWMSYDNMSDCSSCGRMVGQSCIEYGDEGEYCSDECKEDREGDE